MENKMSSVASADCDSIENLNEVTGSDTFDSNSLDNKPLENNGKVSILQRIKNHFLKFRLEAFTFLFTFSNILTNITSTTMIMEKVCRVHLGYNFSICSDLENHTEIKDSVVNLATNYQLGHTLIQTAPAAVLACFIGPWSDHYGRKFPVMLALFGMLLDSIGSAVCAYFLDTRVEYYFIPAIFSGLLGGSVTIMAIVYSYVSDSSTLWERTLKYAFIEMTVGFGTSFGSSAGGWIYKELGFIEVFSFSAIGLCVSFIYGLFIIKETRGLDSEDKWSVKLKKLISCKMLLEGFAAIMKRRPQKGRIQVVLLIISVCFLTIGMNSTGDINYLFARHQFGWSNTTYSNITAIYAIIGIAVLVFLIPALIYFRVTDAYLGLFGTVSLIAKCVGVGLFRIEAVYHVANVLGILGGCAKFGGRSRISKLSRDDDLGKIFTFVATAESLLPIFTSVIMSQLFRACLDFFPGMPYITLGVFLLLPVGVFGWMIFLPKMTFEELAKMKKEGSAD